MHAGLPVLSQPLVSSVGATVVTEVVDLQVESLLALCLGVLPMVVSARCPHFNIDVIPTNLFQISGPYSSSSSAEVVLLFQVHIIGPTQQSRCPTVSSNEAVLIYCRSWLLYHP